MVRARYPLGLQTQRSATVAAAEMSQMAKMQVRAATLTSLLRIVKAIHPSVLAFTIWFLVYGEADLFLGLVFYRTVRTAWRNDIHARCMPPATDQAPVAHRFWHHFGASFWRSRNATPPRARYVLYLASARTRIGS